jgi:hypothetical protein
MADLRFRSQFETTVAKRLARLFSVQRHRLEDTLLSVPARQPTGRLPAAATTPLWPPRPTLVPETFWPALQVEVEGQLASMLLPTLVASADEHGWAGDDVLRWAEKKSRWLARRAARMLGFTNADVWNSITDRWAAAGDTLTKADFHGDLMALLGPARAEFTAIHEIAHAVIVASEKAADKTFGKSPRDKWHVHPERSRSGPCPICAPLHKRPRRSWQRRFPFGPPAHPRCVCTIDYANMPTKGRSRRRLLATR